MNDPEPTRAENNLPPMTDYLGQLADIDPNAVSNPRQPTARLTLPQLACALYEGTPHLSNLAETCARKYGKAEALTFFDMAGEDVRNFWYGIAEQIMRHAMEWEHNEGGGCVLSEQEAKRLKALPRVRWGEDGLPTKKGNE